MKPITLKMLVALAATGVFQSAFGLPNSDMMVKESVNVPSGWIRKSTAPDHQVIPLRFALKQNDVETLEAKLLETSDPKHPLYGQHLSRQQVSSYLRPSQETITQVENWLKRNGIEIDEQNAQKSHAGDYFTVHVPIGKAKNLLGADLAIFQHDNTGIKVIRTQQYSLPKQLDQHIDYVGPLTLFSEPKPQKVKIQNSFKEQGSVISARQNQDAFTTCNVRQVTSECLRKFHQTEGYQPQAADQQLVGISRFTRYSAQVANHNDFQEYLMFERPQAFQAGYDFNVEVINDGNNNQSLAGGEANLDVQTVGGIVYPIPFTYYPAGGLPEFLVDAASPVNTNEPYETELSYFLGLSDDQLPKVISTSYADDEQTVPMAYAKRVCNQIMSLGARGVSLLYGSGDNGVGKNATCISNGVYSEKGKPTFLASFPSTCPYATSVGATQGFSPEVVTTKQFSHIISGGGFSNLFAAPDYQKSVVESYIESLGDKYQGLYNKTGRGYPDLTAQGSRFLIVVNGNGVLESGTSASTPLVASIIALLNDARLAAGKSTLGFLNPLIYSKLLGTDAFNDITNGSSTGCNVEGFPARKGWSAVAGIGSPRFRELVKLVV